MGKCFRAALLLVFLGCWWSPEAREFKEAGRLHEEGRLPEAVTAYEKVMKKFPTTEESLEAARKGSTIALVDTKNYAKAVEFFKHIVLASEKEAERVQAQTSLADIYYERLNDYGSAAIEYNRLLQLQLPQETQQRVRLNLAKSYFYQGKFIPAHSEIKILLENDLTTERAFSAKLLQGNLYQSEKKLDQAIEAFSDLLKNYPEQSKDEQLGLTLAVVYEEKKDFAQAARVLAAIRNNYPKPDFIDNKIRRLEEQQKNLPGAGGLRK